MFTDLGVYKYFLSFIYGLNNQTDLNIKIAGIFEINLASAMKILLW